MTPGVFNLNYLSFYLAKYQKYSFEILRTCSFQNWPYFLNLAK